MITVERLLGVTDVVTHDSCHDGMGTAILIRDVLPNANFHFLQYNTEEYRNFPAGPNQLWCDFSPLPARNQEFVDAKAIVLDHHRGADKVVAAYGDDGVFADEKHEPGVSGAVLAFREVWVKLKQYRNGELAEAHHFAHLVGVRDTFQTQSPFWQDACELAEVLRFVPFEMWQKPDTFRVENIGWWLERKALGSLLWKKHQKSITRAIKNSHGFTTAQGTRVRYFPGNSPITSDTCESLGKSADLVVGFSFVGIEEGLAKIVFSTRSYTGYDCLKFCKSMGGGGHTKAAGFAISFSPTVGDRDPYSLFASALERHEAHESAQAIQP